MVSIISGTKRDNRRPAQQNDSYAHHESNFAHELEKAMAEQEATECYTVTYDAKCQLQTFLYMQHRDYTI